MSCLNSLQVVSGVYGDDSFMNVCIHVCRLHIGMKLKRVRDTLAPDTRDTGHAPAERASHATRSPASFRLLGGTVTHPIAMPPLIAATVKVHSVDENQKSARKTREGCTAVGARVRFSGRME